MRFAGQRFRERKHGMPRQEAESGAINPMRYRPQVQGLEQSMAQMPEVNAARMTKTQEPEFNIGSFQQQEFRK